jgi:hypothetical protein
VRVTGEAFAPRYIVELSPTDLGIPPTAQGSAGPARSSLPVGVRRSPRTSRPRGGPRYIIQCTVCGKKFARITQDQRLRPHKSPQGWDCSGRMGFLVEMKY